MLPLHLHAWKLVEREVWSAWNQWKAGVRNKNRCKVKCKPEFPDGHSRKVKSQSPGHSEEMSASARNEPSSIPGIYRSFPRRAVEGPQLRLYGQNLQAKDQA